LRSDNCSAKETPDLISRKEKRKKETITTITTQETRYHVQK